MARIVRFDCYEVHLDAGQIYKRGARLRLSEQPFRVLAALLEQPGEVVTRDDLRRRLWPDDVFVDFESALNTAVARIREVLSESATEPRFIETLPKRGYRFIAPLTRAASGGNSAPARRTRLLVLPFRDWSRDAGDEYLSDAMTDEVITELATVAPDTVAVIARTTSMRYKGSQKDVARISREIGADYLVEGALRCADETVRVNAQLVRASDQAHVWAKKYDSSRGDLFTVPRSVAQAIAAALDTTAGADERMRWRTFEAKSSTRDPIAYREYLQGRREFDRMNLFRQGAEITVHLEKAIERDPGFALAHEALAQTYWFLAYGGVMAPRDAFAAGVLHAVRAIEIDGGRAETRALIAQYHKQFDYDWPEIKRELSSALQMNPASSLVRLLYAVGWLMPQGCIQEAITELERALEWDPLSYFIHQWLTVMLVLARDWNRAATQAGLMMELEPDMPFGSWLFGIALRGKGLIDESIAAQRRALDLSDGAPMMLGWFGLILGMAGRTAAARAVLDRLDVLARTGYVSPSSFAWVHLGLRDVDRAFEWLDKAVDARDQFMMPIKTYAFFDPIRADPRFAALLRKMKLQA